jgi:hypothetical protein
LPRAGALAGLLLIPLAVPLLIFGAAASGADGGAALKLEAAVALLIVAGAPVRHRRRDPRRAQLNRRAVEPWGPPAA